MKSRASSLGARKGRPGGGAAGIAWAWSRQTTQPSRPDHRSNRRLESAIPSPPASRGLASNPQPSLLFSSSRAFCRAEPRTNSWVKSG